MVALAETMVAVILQYINRSNQYALILHNVMYQLHFSNKKQFLHYSFLFLIDICIGYTNKIVVLNISTSYLIFSFF